MPRAFEEADWESAHAAAHKGLHSTGLLAALLGLLRETPLAGGAADFQMGVHVGDGVWRSARAAEALVTSPEKGVRTMADVWRVACERHADKRCMGWRDIDGMTRDGAKEKYALGPYQWLSYKEAGRRARDFGAGLAALGVRKGAIVNFFADTRAEWQLACQGCMQRGVVVSTTYANLGAEAVAFGINQTQCAVVFTDADLVPLLANEVLRDCAHVRHVVFTRDKRPPPFGRSDDDVRALLAALPHTVEAHAFEDVEALGAGRGGADAAEAPAAEDSCVIMYTSGSTGSPKGVELTHANLVAGVAGCSDAVTGMSDADVYLAYLPLAHILEVCAETSLLWRGVAVGYGSTRTVTDASVCVDAARCKGDASELRPTLMAAVPMIMDKIRAGVLAKLAASGGLARRLFALAFARKHAALQRGCEAPFWDALLFDRLRARLLGGRVRYMLCGGGPLSRETQVFMNVVFCCPVGQGFGLTETVGCATTCWPNDRTYARVGAPIRSVQIKLQDWAEGGYFAEPRAPGDNPRGEVLLGGPQIARGYFANAAATAEAFFEDAGGRWLRTGDIGEMHPDGVLAIVDRKKDLVKLAGGEYVSYGKLEPLLRDSPLVDNGFVYARSSASFCVAVVQASDAAAASSDADVLADVQRVLRAARCPKFEVPQALHVEREVAWGPENDLCTAALKLKRRNLETHYAAQLDALYK